MAEANGTLVQQGRPSEQSQSLHPLVELTTMRMREFLREKEAVFWVFVFPVLITFALGIAFRNTAPDKALVAIEGATSDARVSETANMLSRSAEITATVLSPSEAAQALRSGKVSIVVKPENALFPYRFAPMRRSHYLLSFILSRLVFLVLEVAVMIVFAWLAFGFTVRGSWLSIVLTTILGGFTFSGLGFLLAPRPRNVGGVSGLMNFIMLPMWLLSGTFFSSERFPQILQPFIQALPLTALNNVLRALMNEGTSLSSNWLSIAILLAWCVISFVVALKIFRWQYVLPWCLTARPPSSFPQE